MARGLDDCVVVRGDLFCEVDDDFFDEGFFGDDELFCDRPGFVHGCEGPVCLID